MFFKERSVLIDNEPRHKNKRLAIFKAFIPLVIIAAGILLSFYIFKHSPTAKPITKDSNIPVVKTFIANAQDLQIPIQLQGLTQASDLRPLSSQLNGTIIAISDKFRENAIIQKNEWLFKVENQQAQMEISQAEVRLQTAKSHLRTVKATIESNAQALRELGVTPPRNPPQLADARLQIQAAQQQLKTLKEQVGKVNMYAPFAAKIIKPLISNSDIVAIGRPIAQVISSEKLLAKFPITDNNLEILDQQAFTQNNKQAINISNADETQQWSANLIGLETSSQLNGQFNYLLAEIYHPFAENNNALSIGSSVKLTINSKFLNNILKLPLSTLHNGNEVWTLDAQQKLKINKVDIIHKDKTFAYTNSAIETPVHIIDSIISFPVDGMQLKQSK